MSNLSKTVQLATKPKRAAPKAKVSPHRATRDQNGVQAGASVRASVGRLLRAEWKTDVARGRAYSSMMTMCRVSSTLDVLIALAMFGLGSADPRCSSPSTLIPWCRRRSTRMVHCRRLCGLSALD